MKAILPSGEAVKTLKMDDIVRRHAPLVYAEARRRLRDHHLAEDATQTVFLLLSRRAHALPPEPVLPIWLRATARKVSASLLRSESRRRRRELGSSRPERVSADDARPDLARLVHEALELLSEDERRTLRLRYFEGASLREVGGRLGITLHAAAMRVNRALEKVQGHLRRRGLAIGLPALAVLLSKGLAPTAAAAAVAAGGAFGVVKLAGIAATLAIAALLIESPPPAVEEERPLARIRDVVDGLPGPLEEAPSAPAEAPAPAPPPPAPEPEPPAPALPALEELPPSPAPRPATPVPAFDAAPRELVERQRVARVPSAGPELPDLPAFAPPKIVPPSIPAIPAPASPDARRALDLARSATERAAFVEGHVRAVLDQALAPLRELTLPIPR